MPCDAKPLWISDGLKKQKHLEKHIGSIHTKEQFHHTCWFSEDVSLNWSQSESSHGPSSHV